MPVEIAKSYKDVISKGDMDYMDFIRIARCKNQEKCPFATLQSMFFRVVAALQQEMVFTNFNSNRKKQIDIIIVIKWNNKI